MAKLSNTNPWFYQGRPIEEADIEGYIGFVYLIENTLNGRKYLGKKLFTKAKTIQKNKKKRRTRVPSDWQTYYGSNQELLDDVKQHGAEHFKRTILHLCKSKGTANYLEAQEQMVNRVLEDRSWYNDWIMCKVHRSHIKLA